MRALPRPAPVRRARWGALRRGGGAQLLDCFLTGTVPLYWGARSTLARFDADGVIFLGDGGADDALAAAGRALDALSAELYARMLPAARRNFEAAKLYLDPLGWAWRNVRARCVTKAHLPSDPPKWSGSCGPGMPV